MNITKCAIFFVVLAVLPSSVEFFGQAGIAFATPNQLKAACPISSNNKACGTPQENIISSSDYVEASQEEIAILGRESFHANIAMIEKALKERGVNTPEKGFITSELRAALIAFQESVSLPVNGQINAATLEKLGVKF